MKSIVSRSILTVLFVIASVIGFAVFRFYYNVSTEFPFTQEFILVLLGVISTVLITAILLIQQSKLDLRKEEKVLLVNQKNTIYMGIIEEVSMIADNRDFEPKSISRLKILNHKLSIVGSILVVRNFNKTLDLLLEGLEKKCMTEPQAEELMHSIAELTFYMRADLLGENLEEIDGVMGDIISNSKDIEQVEDRGNQP